MISTVTETCGDAGVDKNLPDKPQRTPTEKKIADGARPGNGSEPSWSSPKSSPLLPPSDAGSDIASDSTELSGCHILDPQPFEDQWMDAQDKVVFNIGDALIVMPDTVYAKYKNELEFTVE